MVRRWVIVVPLQSTQSPVASLSQVSRSSQIEIIFGTTATMSSRGGERISSSLSTSKAPWVKRAGDKRDGRLIKGT